MNWVRLKAGNDWGCVYFAIEPLLGGTAYSKRGIKLCDGDETWVRWPNGEVTKNSIKIVNRTNVVWDHGRSESVVSNEPHVVVDHNGVESTVRIDLVDVPLDWARERGAQ